MGFGSLRATLFHILAAEQIWLERWTGVAWRPFPIGSSRRFACRDRCRFETRRRRTATLMSDERSAGWQRVVTYRDGKGVEYRKPLDDLLLHVANHGIHHRAQVLNYLKGFGRTVPVGLDYLFYRLARPSVVQGDATVTALRGYGMEINSAPGVEIAWDAERMRRYFAYHDWANAQILELAGRLDDAVLDRNFDLGTGYDSQDARASTERGTRVARRCGPRDQARSTLSARRLSVGELRVAWSQAARQRDEFLAELNDAAAQRMVAINFGGPPIQFRIIESARADMYTWHISPRRNSSTCSVTAVSLPRLSTTACGFRVNTWFDGASRPPLQSGRAGCVSPQSLPHLGVDRDTIERVISVQEQLRRQAMASGVGVHIRGRDRRRWDGVNSAIKGAPPRLVDTATRIREHPGGSLPDKLHDPAAYRATLRLMNLPERHSRGRPPASSSRRPSDASRHSPDHPPRPRHHRTGLLRPHGQPGHGSGRQRRRSRLRVPQLPRRRSRPPAN